MPEKRTIVIDPVTRIEGHAKITLHLDEQGEVSDARFHVTQFRGFEKLCEGRPFTEMPSLMARICGICPVSHLIASAKACDALLAVRIPPTADKLRRIFNMAQIVQSPYCWAWTPIRRRAIYGELPKEILNWPVMESVCGSSVSKSLNASAASAFTQPGLYPAVSANL
jgi:hypothetical protein